MGIDLLSVAAYAVLRASMAGDEDVLESLIIPTTLSLERTCVICPHIAASLSRELCKWQHRPRLRPWVDRVSGILLGAKLSDCARPQNPFFGITDATKLASILGEHNKKVENGDKVENQVQKVSKSLAHLTPRAAIALVKNSNGRHDELREQYDREAMRRIMASKNRSWASTASHLRTWGQFCTKLGVAHFPVDPDNFAKFGVNFRNHTSYQQALSALKASCDLLGLPNDWATCPQIRRVAGGIEKLKFVHPKPRRSVRAAELRAIFTLSPGIPEELLLISLGYCFMLRTASEGANLLRGTVFLVTQLRLPMACDPEGVIALAGSELIIRLRSRKTSIWGATIRRGCACEVQGPGAYVFPEICPVHVIWPRICQSARPGERIFGHGVASKAVDYLRTMLRHAGVARPNEFGLHALRRGAAQDLVECGGDLPTLLMAGGWKSTAFRAYLDGIGLESQAFAKSVTKLVDLDDE